MLRHCAKDPQRYESPSVAENDITYSWLDRITAYIPDKCHADSDAYKKIVEALLAGYPENDYPGLADFLGKMLHPDSSKRPSMEESKEFFKSMEAQLAQS